MKKQNNGLIDFNTLGDLDPVISATISNGQRRAADRTLPQKERKAKIRERAKAEARNGRRSVYDMDPELIRELAALAEKHQTSASQLAALAVWFFLDAIDKGQIQVRDYLQPVNNPRYAYLVNWQKSGGGKK